MTATTRPPAKRGPTRPATPEQLVEKIRFRISPGAEGVVEIGQALTELRELLPDGQFQTTVRDELDLHPSDTRRYRAIAAHPVLSQRENFSRCPGNLSTLYELSLVDHSVLRRAIASGKVSPRTVAREATELRTGMPAPDDSPVSKPDLNGKGLSHPARFSPEILAVIGDLLHAELLLGHRRVLDPFCGTGKIHTLAGFDTVGVEIEPEWAALAAGTIVGSALALPFTDEYFDAIATSPTYANRNADHHNAADPHLRRSYTFDLGRPLTPGNTGDLQWGKRYRDLHVSAWAEAARVLRPGGAFVLNIKDHTRDRARVAVSSWHVATLMERHGLAFVDCVGVKTDHLAQGENAEARWSELVWLLRKP